MRTLPTYASSRSGSEIGLTGEDAITRFGAFSLEPTTLGVENFHAQRMEFSVGRWRSEAEGVFVAQNFGNTSINGDEFFVLRREKGLTAAGIGEGLECAVCGVETEARRCDGV